MADCDTFVFDPIGGFQVKWRVFLVPFALLVVGFVRFLSPWKVRFGELWSHRLGHLIGNTECYLCERDEGLHDGFYDIWVSNRSGISSNRLIEKKYEKKLHVMPRWFGSVVILVNRLFKGWEKHSVQTQQVDRDINNWWEKHSPHICFTEAEEKKGKELLKSLGIEGKWVCLSVRDSSYLKKHHPQMDYSYHDYRDADILDCIPAVIELANRGFYVVRMGAVVGKPFNVDHPKIIDYATKHRTEFGDLYLGAKCTFCLSTSSGFTTIPIAFGRPTAFFNHAPLEYSTVSHRGLMIWKHHIKDGKRMTTDEIFSCGAGLFTFRQQFEALGITLENNSPQEILDLAIEMAEGFSTEDQSNFWGRFPLKTMVNGRPLHGQIRMRIGQKFLNEYE